MAHVQSMCRARSISPAPSRQWLADLFTLVNVWRRRARGRQELAALSDRCLRDIGLTRYDALREVRKPFWRA
jgi:uncharacterized protein YjiS (DUF1127 family)